MMEARKVKPKMKTWSASRVVRKIGPSLLRKIQAAHQPKKWKDTISATIRTSRGAPFVWKPKAKRIPI